MDAERMQQIYTQVAIGIRKEDSPFPLTADEEVVWDDLAAGCADAVAAGFTLDMPEIEVPDIPANLNRVE